MMDVGDVNSIDIMGIRKDGGIDLKIITVGRFKGTPDEQTKLMNKIENYLGYIVSEDFSQKYGSPTKERVRIILILNKKPNRMIFGLEKKIAAWTHDNHADFKLVL